MYYLGVEEWLKDMYNQEDLVDHMRNDIGGPPGSLQESHGWKAKITDNPVMQEDVRHLGLVGTADSVPYFKQPAVECRSCFATAACLQSYSWS